MEDEAETIQTTTTEATPAPDAVAPVAATETVAETDSSLLGGEGADDAAPAADAAPAGPPEAYELTAPEGITLDAASIELATPVFKDLGLNNEQANKLMPVAAEFAKRIQDQGQQAIMTEVMAQRREWLREVENDTTLFADQVGEDDDGDPVFEINPHKRAKTLALTAKALDTLGAPKGSPFRSFLTDSGLGNHPEMIRMFRKIGETIGEDNSFVRADGAAPIERNPARIMYPNNPPKGA